LSVAQPDDRVGSHSLRCPGPESDTAGGFTLAQFLAPLGIDV